MKRLFIIVGAVALTISFLGGCRKAAPINTDDSLIQTAQAYFQHDWQNAPAAAPDPNPRNTGPRTPDWQNARVIHLPAAITASTNPNSNSNDAPNSTDAVLVPIHYSKPFYIGSNFGGIRQYPIDDLAHLLIYRDSAHVFHAEMVTALPDSNYKDLPAPFTGLILVDQWNGQPLGRYRYDGKGAQAWFPYQAAAPNQRHIVTNDIIIQTCLEIGGYNYAPSAPGTDYAWSESVGCVSQFISEEPSSVLLSAANYSTLVSGAGASNILHPIYPGDGGIVDGTNLTFQYDPLPAINLSQYFKCFTYIPDQGATYSVTLCTDIPVDNNPGALVSTGFQVGHTFLILTKTNGQVSLSQSFGFYPQNSVLSSVKQYVASKISDDGSTDHQYDASLSMPNISQLDFQTIENYALNLGNSQQYSLYNYNCTNYALQVFNSIRINNPVTVSDWIGAYTGIDFGQTPNGLYQALVGMQTFVGGAPNPFVKVGSLHAPASAGACN